MTSPVILQSTALELRLRAWRPLPLELRSEVAIHLPGMAPYVRNYYADPADPEEVAAFYDDVTHEARTWRQLFDIALDDLCHMQPKLF